jgi:hypothetical protein
METWVNLEDQGFPDYAASNEGRIRNELTERILRQSPNQSGLYKVSITSARNVRITLSVALLVAKVFVPLEAHLRDRFDTPINVNGDRSDNRAENLMWRPRWFAIMYHQQFHNDRRGVTVPIVDTKTGERFENSWEAAMKYGLLDREILHAIHNKTYLFPTGHIFEMEWRT